MNLYSITDFGAKPDGEMNTKEIQRTIDACAITGGTVVIPAGTYDTGTLELKSNVSLYLCRNAVLKGSSSLEDYQSFGYVHNEWGEVFSLIYAVDCHNIIIEGEGHIDFNGDVFFDYSKPWMPDVDLKALPEEQKKQFVVACNKRPNQMIFFRKCQNIQIRNASFYHAPCWGLVFSSCEQIKITGITIRFGQRIPNNDGIHLCSCTHVMIRGCDIKSGDDCIAVSGIDDWLEESCHILISDCILSSSSAGIRMGYFCSKVRNVQISNCIIHQSNRGICIMGCRGGYVKDVIITGLNIDTKSRAGGWWGRGEAIYLSALDHDIQHNWREGYEEVRREHNIENIVLRDIVSNCENGIVIAGERGNIFNISFYHIRLRFIDSINRKYFGNKMDFLPGIYQRTVPEDTLYWIFAKEAEKVKVTDFTIESSLSDAGITIESCLEDCSQVLLQPTF